ncbi:conserved hypothetical protein [Tenacibaculum dicentrarchi]|uniref:Uncharacterized protein n=1 Tax=Tenacibaculum dicentrarchi TaxID=669041 RepID=A0ABM9NY32_9FLAO|nr:conserved hypothetical protein [Tenacibaculum dicentrarchi]
MSEKKENNEEIKNTELKPLFDFVENIIKDLKISEIIEKNNEIKSKKIEADKILDNSKLTFWKWKMSKDLIICILLLFTIILLSMNGVIKESITGTLLGSVIGYTIGNGSVKKQKD